jgi:hypothetical protein
VPYVMLLYQLPSFHVVHFKNAIRDAKPPADTLEVTEDGLVFLEPSMQRGVLHFSQMPRAAAMLHFLHTLYGFSTLVDKKRKKWVAGIFSPLIAPALGLPLEDNKETRDLWSAKQSVPPPRNFDELAQVARTLIEHDIRSVFGSSSARRQFQALWSYLRKCESEQKSARNTGYVGLRDQVNDDRIFDFWRTHAPHKSKGDWREFKTAAVAMLRIYRALAIADTARSHESTSERQSETQFAKAAIDKASEQDDEPSSQDLSDPLGQQSDHGEAPSSQKADASSDQGGPAEELPPGVWTSPLVHLRLAHNRPVKFLKGTGIERLANYLDGVLGAASDDFYDPDKSKVLAEVARHAANAARGQKDIGKLQGVAKRADLEDVYVHVLGSERKARAAIQQAKPQLALMGRDQFDLNFVRTLLRVDVFSPWQAKLPTKPTATRDSNYASARRDYSEIQADIIDAMLAAVHLLGRRGDRAAPQLIRFLTGTRGPLPDPEIPHYFAATAGGQAAVAPKDFADIAQKLFAALRDDEDVPEEVKIFIENSRDISAILRKFNGAGLFVQMPVELQHDLLDTLKHGGPLVRKYFEFDADSQRALSERLKSAFQPSTKRRLDPHSASVDQFIERCKAAADANNSSGFRSKDYPMLEAAFNKGRAGSAIIDLYEELDRLNGRLGRSFPGDKLDVADAEDSSCFSDVFRQLGFG